MKLLYMFETNIPRLEGTQEAIEQYTHQCETAIAACFKQQAGFDRFSIIVFDDDKLEQVQHELFKKLTASTFPVGSCKGNA